MPQVSAQNLSRFLLDVAAFPTPQYNMSHRETTCIKKDGHDNPTNAESPSSMTVRLNGAGTGETFAAGAVSFRILDDGHGVEGRFGVVECKLAPGWAGPPQHIHREHDETFYVVTGTVTFTSGTEVLTATSGSLVTVPIGDPHTFANTDSVNPATLLCTVTPERYLGYLRELQGLTPNSNGQLNPSEVLAVMSRYATEPYRP